MSTSPSPTSPSPRLPTELQTSNDLPTLLPISSLLTTQPTSVPSSNSSTIYEVLPPGRALLHLLSTFKTPPPPDLHPDILERLKTVQCLALRVEPRDTQKVIKALAEVAPIKGELGHLKRVKKVTDYDNGIDTGGERDKKKAKVEGVRPKKVGSLMVLVMTKCEWDLLPQASRSTFSSRLSGLGSLDGDVIEQMVQVPVPLYPPATSELRKHMEVYWPQVLHHSMKDGRREESNVLTEGDDERFRRFMGVCESANDVIMVDPNGDYGRGVIASSGKAESQHQALINGSETQMNILQTPTVLAIQGQARNSRNSQSSTVENDNNTDTQYLCTGYECYMIKEPNHYDAMALLHARVGAVIFKVWDKGRGGLGGSKGKGMIGVHEIDDTNHTYRVFNIGGL